MLYKLCDEKVRDDKLILIAKSVTAKYTFLEAAGGFFGKLATQGHCSIRIDNNLFEVWDANALEKYGKYINLYTHNASAFLYANATVEMMNRFETIRITNINCIGINFDTIKSEEIKACLSKIDTLNNTSGNTGKNTLLMNMAAKNDKGSLFYTIAIRYHICN